MEEEQKACRESSESDVGDRRSDANLDEAKVPGGGSDEEHRVGITDQVYDSTHAEICAICRIPKDEMPISVAMHQSTAFRTPRNEPGTPRALQAAAKERMRQGGALCGLKIYFQVHFKPSKMMDDT